MNNALTVYRSIITETFSFLKETCTLEELYTRGIRLDKTGGMLLPVCRLHQDDAQMIALFSQWRRENDFAYPGRFQVTDAGTASWLRDKLLAVPDRILFLVQDAHGHNVGHIGFANCLNDEGLMEIDNVLRGVKEGNPGIMADALSCMVKWARTTLWPEGFYLRVLASNDHAVAFYRKLGLVETGRTPLRRIVSDAGSNLVPPAEGDTAAADDHFIRFSLAGEPSAAKAGQEMILTAGPSISQRESSYAYDAAKYGWNNQWSKYLSSFESAFAKYVGVKYALATSSGTGALHLSLAALGIGPGDEVIVPDITWVATANAVLYVGATPIFADIDRDTWLVDPASIEAKVTPRTKAIMVVHLYGHACDMDRIGAIARKHDLHIVEDAAPSIGAQYKGRHTGSFGSFACFSFQGAKLSVTGEGGMLLTNDDRLYERAYEIWNQGRNPGTFWIRTNGLKYKMSNVQAAIGLGQLERIDALVEAKRRIFRWYEEGLDGVPHLALCREPEETRSIYWMSSICLDESSPMSRDELAKHLKALNVDTRPVFPAISQYPIWPLRQPPLPVAKFVGDHAMNLPSGVCLSHEQVQYVCRCIREALSC
ncbi:MAG: aminotransferase class I/II-fold pyridoxal phosphate-dependent enzyme [Opitutales bacterium]|nr:aminotransferase class I/II-fold pyridoxal phosphate-dependent enzyme [Opitutales bacterium]